MKEILAATRPKDITVEVQSGRAKVIFGDGRSSRTLLVGDTMNFEAASFTEVPVPDEVYWTVRAAEALGGNF